MARPWPRLTSVEGKALVHLERMLGATGGSLSPESVRLAEPLRPAVAELGRRRMAAAVLRFLVEAGGWRQRTVLRARAAATGGAEERLAGRLWDRPLNDGFRLDFSANARAFWLASARHLPSLTTAARQDGDGGVRQRRRAVRDMLPLTTSEELGRGAPPATGDWALFALVHERLVRFGLTDEGAAALGRRLRLASPLALLLALEGDEPGDAAVEERLRPLLAPGAVRLVECVEDRLVASWTARVAEAQRLLQLELGGTDAVARLVGRWTGLGRALRAWERTVDAARRMDLARPLVRLARLLVTQLFVDGGEALRRQVSGIGALRSMYERDQVVAAIAVVIDLGPSLLRRRDLLARERYGDPRYLEAQLFLRDVDGELTPLRARVEGLAQGLSGIIT